MISSNFTKAYTLSYCWSYTFSWDNSFNEALSNLGSLGFDLRLTIAGVPKNILWTTTFQDWLKRWIMGSSLSSCILEESYKLRMKINQDCDEWSAIKFNWVFEVWLLETFVIWLLVETRNFADFKHACMP